MTIKSTVGSQGSYDDSAIAFYQTQKDYSIKFTHVPTDTTRVFPAFLTSFEDSFQSTWNPEQVYGRYDPIYTFQNTKRTITFAFEAPAADENEAAQILADLRTVTRMLYPTYQNDGFATTLSKAPLMRIKFANLIGQNTSGHGRGLLGVLNGFSISPIVENGFFDPAPSRLYPKAFNVNVTFDVLHEQSPGAWPNESTPPPAETNPNPTGGDIPSPEVEALEAACLNPTADWDAANPVLIWAPNPSQI